MIVGTNTMIYSFSQQPNAVEQVPNQVPVSSCVSINPFPTRGI